MKNFRKVLALVLVVATLLSFATMASADYKDQADIAAEYEIAVDILTGLGILNGEKKGDDVVFRPTDEIDRDEVAKMVAVLCNGGADIEEYYADACTFADTKNTWAAGYVAYCYHTGIVDGRNATTFDPDASITGYEVAKMLLCVMGFDADEMGYVGKDYKVNVLRDARNFGLLDGMNKDFNLKKNVTRQEVAMMMINALAAPIVVGTISENIVKISNAAYLELGFGLKDIEAGELAVLYGNVVIFPKQHVGDMFGIYTIDVFNNVGRPSMRWGSTWNGWSKDYPYAAASKSVAGISKAKADVVFVDGELKDEVWTEKTLSGKGLVVETYKTLSSGTVAVVLNTDVAQVTYTYKALGTKYFEYELDEVASQTVSTTVKNTAPYAVGDILLVNYYNSKISGNQPLTKHTAYLAAATYKEVTPVKATITRTIHNPSEYYGEWTQANSSFVATVENKGYHYNNWFKSEDAIFDTKAIGKEYALYFDGNGYVVYWDLWENVNPTVYDYQYALFVEDTWKDVYGNTVTADGVEVKHYNDFVDFSAKYLDDVQVAAEDCDMFAGQLVEYVNVNGVVKVTDEATFANMNAFDTETGTLDLWYIDAGVEVTIELTTTSATKFLIRVLNAKGEYEYEAFTGYKAVAAKYPGILYGGYAQVQYFLNAENPLKADYVFIDAAYLEVEELFYVVGWEETQSDIQVNDQLSDYEVYKVIVDGQIAYMLINTPEIAGYELPAGLYSGAIEFLGLAVDGAAIYAAAEPADELEILAAVSFVEIDDGKLFYEAYNGEIWVAASTELAEDYTIWVVDYTKDPRAYSKVTGYTDAEKFNDEVVEDVGYRFERVWVETNDAGEITNIYVERIVR